MRHRPIQLVYVVLLASAVLAQTGNILFRFEKKQSSDDDGGFAIEEGREGVYTVKLFTKPTHDIALLFDSVDPLVNVLTPSLNFTIGNWTEPQELHVEGVDDDVIRSVTPYGAVVRINSRSENKTYDTIDGDLGSANLTLLIAETDKAGIFVAKKLIYPSPPDIPEGRSSVFEISLASRPQYSVLVNFTVLNETIYVEPLVMQFKPDDWNVTQDLIVYSVDDLVQMPNPYGAQVQIKTRSKDENFEDAEVPNLHVTIEDNDDGVGSTVRQMSVSWQRDLSVSRTTANFIVEATFDINDQTISSGDIVKEKISLDFGDGQLQEKEIYFKVGAVNDLGVFTATSSLTHTYPGPNNRGQPWIASLEQCCRKSTIQNNAGTLRSLRTDVDLNYESSPVPASLPTIRLSANSKNQSFFIPGLSAGGRLVSHRLGTPADYGAAYSGSPQFVSIEPATGRVTINASDVAPGEYNLLFVIRDEISGLTTPLEVALESFPAVDRNEAPHWSGIPPISGTDLPSDVYYVSVGDRLDINLTASDSDPGDNMTIVATSVLPEGAELSEPHRIYGVRNTVRSVLSWSPVGDQIGVYVICFQINSALQTSLPYCVRIAVVKDSLLLPSIDLNGPANGLDYSTEFIKGKSAEIPVSDSGAKITSPTNGRLTRMALSVINAQDGDDEYLNLDENFLPPQLQLFPLETGLQIRGEAPVKAYEQVLRHIMYGHKGKPTPGRRAILLTLYDGHRLGTGKISIDVSIQNQAPSVSLSGSEASYFNRFFPGEGPVSAVDPSKAYVSDVDSRAITGAVFQLENIRNPGYEHLNVTYESPEKVSLPIVRESRNLDVHIGVDDETAESTLFVNKTGVLVGQIDVIIDIRHSFISDLKVELEHNGYKETLVNRPGGGSCSKDDLTTAYFSDTGMKFLPLSASDGTPGLCRFQSQGVFSPDGHLGVFQGMNASGDWKLSVTDSLLEKDTGRLAGWSLIVFPQEENFVSSDPSVVPEVKIPAGDRNERRYYRKVESDGRIKDVTVGLHLGVPFAAEFVFTPSVSLRHPDGTMVNLLPAGTSVCKKGSYKHIALSDSALLGPVVECGQTSSPPPPNATEGSGSGSGSGSGIELVSDSGSGSGSLPTLSTTSAPTSTSVEVTYKAAYFDVVKPAQPLGRLLGKAAGGEYTLIVKGLPNGGEVSILGWSMRVAREPNIDWSYNAANGRLNLIGVDSPKNYKAVIRTIQYQNAAFRPDFSIDRRIVASVTDGEIDSNRNSTSAMTFITMHHIEIDLDPVNVSAANFPGFSVDFVESGPPVYLVDIENAYIRDLGHKTGLYVLTVKLENVLNPGYEGIRVNEATRPELQVNSSTAIELKIYSNKPEPVEKYQDILRTITYFNLAEEPEPESRLISFFVEDLSLGDQFVSSVATANVSIVLLNDPPILDLNIDYDDTDSVSTIVEYSEGQGGLRLINASKLNLTDTDSENLSWIQVTITNRLDGFNEVLSADEVKSTNIKVIFDNSTGILTLNGTDTLENYRRVLLSMEYTNAKAFPGFPNTTPRLISFVANDGLTHGSAVVAKVFFSAVNDAPFLDANGPKSGVDYSVEFKEEEGPVSVVDSRMTAYDVDNVTLKYVTVQIINLLDGSLESLSVSSVVESSISDLKSVTYTSIKPNVTYDESTGRLTITGLATVREYQQVLKTLKYDNLADEPDPSPRQIFFTLNDGLLDSLPVYSTVNVTLINDSPRFNLSVPVLHPHLDEDTPDNVNPGFSLADLTEPIIIDDDVGHEKGIAITKAASQNGKWQYKTSSTKWIDMRTNLTAENALVIRGVPTNFLRFVPDLNFNGDVNLHFVAWDATDGLNDGAYVNATSSSYTDPFSSYSALFTLTVDPVNDAPVMTEFPRLLEAIHEDDVNSDGDEVSRLLVGVRDVDIDGDLLPSLGIAIFESDEENGTWQYSVRNRSVWIDLGFVNESLAVVLDSKSRIRFVPDRDFNGKVSFRILAWDLTSSEAPGTRYVDVQYPDPVTGAFSVNQTDVVITVDAVNDSPVLTGNLTLHPIDEDAPEELNHGTSVDDILKGGYYDVDVGARSGIAVLTVDERFGQWQYFCAENGSVWMDFIGDKIYGKIFPELPLPDKATLLAGDCRVRFLPEKHFETSLDYDGYPRPASDMPYIILRAWDRTGATERSTAGSYGVDTTYAAESDTNEFSATDVWATIEVLAKNDGPVLMLYNSTKATFETVFVEDQPGVHVVGPDFVLIDYDHDRLTSIVITVNEGDFSGSGSGSGDSVGPYCAGETERREELLINLSGTDLTSEVVTWCPFSLKIFPNYSMPTAPISHFRKALHTVLYNNSIEEPDAGVRRVAFSVYDELGGSTTVETRITVELVNDAPLLDLNGLRVGNAEFVEYAEGQGAMFIVNQTLVTLVDYDDLFADGFTVRIVNAPDADYEILDAEIVGFNVTKTYDIVTSILSVVGRETVANYQAILRTVTYENAFADPGNPDAIERVIEFVVNDGDKDSPVARSYVGFTAVNNRPFLDLNGDGAGEDNVVGFTEERGAIGLVSQDLIGWDIDNVTLDHVTAQILSVLDSDLEILSVESVTAELVKQNNLNQFAKVLETTRLVPNVTYNKTDGLLTIRGLDSVYEYMQVLKTLTYNNLADEPQLDNRSVEVILSDGLLESVARIATVKMIPINDPPRFIPRRRLIRPHILEDVEDASNPGQTVEDMVANLIEDDDVQDPRGIAVVGVQSVGGQWQYKRGGFGWKNINNNTNETTALLLAALNSTYVRFVPDKDFNGPVSITFAAWDRSDGLDEGTTRIAIQKSDTSSVSAEKKTMTWTVVPVNDAPVLDVSVQPRMTTVLEDSVWERSSAGDSVDVFLSAWVYDVDGNRTRAQMGIAVIETDTRRGYWEFTTNDGTKWENIGPVTPDSALVLANTPAGQNRLRFVPNRDFNGDAYFVYKIWDRNSTELSGTLKIGVAASDPVTGPYSEANTSAWITVEPVNDSPVLKDSPSLFEIEEDVSANINSGTQVEDILLESFYNDVDEGASVGLAVVGIDRRFGVWEYSCDVGRTVTWLAFIGNMEYGLAVPRDPQVDKATLLAGNCRIRFRPNEHFNTEFDYNGDPRPESDKPFLEIRGWDNTGSTRGKSNTYGVNTVSVPDDHTNEFSENITKLTVIVTSTNDGPVLRLAAETNDIEVTFVEAYPPERRVIPVYIVDPVGLSFLDSDHAYIQFATVTFTPVDSGYENLTLDLSGTKLESQWSSPDGIQQSLRIRPRSDAVPVSEYEKVLRTLKYENSAEEPHAKDRIATFIAYDGETFSDPVVSTIHVQLINDPPELDLDGHIPDRGSFKVYREGQGSLLLANASMTLIDHDSAILDHATVTITEAPDADKEVLVAISDGTAIAVSYNGSRLLLQGPDSVANFSRVLLSVAYNNTYARPGDPDQRERRVEFVVNDGLNDSIVAVSRLTFVGVNDRPYLDVSGDSPGVDYSVVFSEEKGPVGLVDSGMFIIEEDNETLAYAKVQLLDIKDPGMEILDVDENVRLYSDDIGSDKLTVINIRPKKSYDKVTGILTITGLKSSKDYEHVLKTITYNNVADEPDNSTRIIRFTLSDGLLDSNPVFSRVAIELVNDSPYFNTSASVLPVSIKEDLKLDENEGFSIWTVVHSVLLDDDQDSLPGMAVVYVDASHGRWEYTTDFRVISSWFGSSVSFSATWKSIRGNETATESAVLLRLSSNGTNRIRFIADGDFVGAAALTFVAWDGTDGLPDGTVGNATSASRTDPFSADSRTITVNVEPVNDAPVLPREKFTLTGIKEDNTKSQGDAVSVLLVRSTDVDTNGDVAQGIAVIGADETNGWWEFTSSGTNWTRMTSPAKGVVLSSSQRIRFRPTLHFHGTSSFTFVAWDMTDGTFAGQMNVSVLAADPITGAFSVANSTAEITVEPVNDSPVLQSGSVLHSIAEDLNSDLNNGTLVADIVSSSLSDVDDASEPGIAVIGVDLRYGMWQWRCPGRSSWQEFIGDIIYGVVLPKLPRPEKATLLGGDCSVRFLSNHNFNTLKDTTGAFRPESDRPYLDVRGWDNTGISFGKSGRYGQDTTYHNASVHNEFSQETSTAVVDVLSVNDVPVLRLSQQGNGSLFATEMVEESPFVRIVNETVMSLVDEDHRYLESVTVTIRNVEDPFDETIRLEPLPGSLVNVSSDGRSASVCWGNGTCETVELVYSFYRAPLIEPTSAENRTINVTERPTQRPTQHPTPFGSGSGRGSGSGSGSGSGELPATELPSSLSGSGSGSGSGLGGGETGGNMGVNMSSNSSDLNTTVLPKTAQKPAPISRIILTIKTATNRSRVSRRAYEELIRSLVYVNGHTEPNNATRLIDIAVDDTEDVTVVRTEITIILTVDNQPQLTLNFLSTDFVEGSAPIRVTSDRLRLTDDDHNDFFSIARAVLRIEPRYILSMESLFVNTTFAKASGIAVDYNSSRATLTLSGDAHILVYERLLRTAMYNNSEEEPVPGERNITFEVTDAAGLSSDVETFRLNVVVINDRIPELQVGGPFRFVERQLALTIGDDIVFSDADSGDFLQEKIDIVITNGRDGGSETLNVSASLGSINVLYSPYILTLQGPAPLEDFQRALKTLSYLNTAEEPSSEPRKIHFEAFDGNFTSSPAIITVFIETVNDLPVLDLNGLGIDVNHVLEYEEGSDPVLIVVPENLTLYDNDNSVFQWAKIVLVDRPDAPEEILSVNSTGTNISVSYERTNGSLLLNGPDSVDSFLNVLKTVSYFNEKHSPGHPTLTARRVEFVVNDGRNDSLPAFSIITFKSVNDAPILDLNGNAPFVNFSVDFTEEGVPVRAVDPLATVEDIDSPQLQSISVTIANLKNRGDELLNVTVEPRLRSSHPAAVVIYNASAGILTMTGFGSPANFQSVLRTLVYDHTADEPDFEPRVIEILASDGQLLSDPVYTVVNLIPVNDEPRLSVASTGVFFTAFREDEQPIGLVDSKYLLIEDDDDRNLSSLHVTIRNVQDPGFEALYFDSGSSPNFSPGVLPLYSSCPPAGKRNSSLDIMYEAAIGDWRRALLALRYCNADEHPVNGTRFVDFYLTDSSGASSLTRSAEIDLSHVNDAPLFVRASATFTVVIQEDENVTVPVLASFYDHEETLTGAAIRIVKQPEFGKAAVDSATGDVTFYSHSNDYGNRTFSYRACDRHGDCSPVQNITVVIKSVNDPPVLVEPLEVHLLEDTPVRINISDFFADVEDDLNPSDGWPRVTAVSGPTRGSWDLKSDNQTLRFEPYKNEFGEDGVLFTACDSDGACVSGKIRLIIGPVNDHPVVSVEYGPDGAPAVATEDQKLNVSIVIEELEDRSPLTVAVIGVDRGSAVPDGKTIRTYIDHARNLQVQEMNIVYTPPKNYYGSDVVRFRVTDSEGGQDDGVVNITVVYKNDAPLFGKTTVDLLEDETLTLTLPAGLNIVDAEDTLNASSIELLTNATIGKVSYDGGQLVFIPPKNFYSTESKVVNFTLRACDYDVTTPTSRLCSEAIIYVNVISVNDAPSVPLLTTSLFEDKSTVYDLWAQLTDVEDGKPPKENISVVSPWPTLGSARYDNKTGRIMYSGNGNKFGTDDVNYQVCDSESLCSRGVLKVVINDVNDPPLAEGFLHNSPEDEYDLIAIYPHVSDNETLPYDVVEKLRISIRDPVTGSYVDRLVTSKGGELKVYHAHGIITYYPSENFVGPDNFTYAVCDLCDERRNKELGRVALDVPSCLQQIAENKGSQFQSGGQLRIACSEATVQIQVGNVNDVPQVRDISATSYEHKSVLLEPFAQRTIFADSSFIVYDRDDEQAISIRNATLNETLYGVTAVRTDINVNHLAVVDPSPKGGEVTVLKSKDGRASLQYSPLVSFKGYDSFGFEVCDRHSLCSKAIARIHVTVSGPVIVSVTADGGVDSSGIDRDSKFSRTDTFVIEFAEDTNMPPGIGIGNEFFTSDVDQLLDFGDKFINNVQVSSRYTAAWLDRRRLRVTIVDEGYPQPEVIIGSWTISIKAASPCGGFSVDHATLEPNQKSRFCLLDAAGDSLHANTSSPVLEGDWGNRLPAVHTVTINNVVTDQVSEDYIGGLSDIHLYFKPPFSYLQFEAYCDTDVERVLDVPYLLGEGGYASVVGCSQLLADGTDANEIYRNSGVDDGNALERAKRASAENGTAILTVMPIVSKMAVRVQRTSSELPTEWIKLQNRIKMAVRNETIVEIVTGVTGIDGTRALDYSSKLSASTTDLYWEHDDTKTPRIFSQSVVGRITRPDGVFTSGDSIIVNFHVPTNQPPIDSRASIDLIFEFYPSLGSAYIGRWINSSALELTIEVPSDDPNNQPSMQNFRFQFKPNYLRNGQQLHIGNEEIPTDKPNCIGINVCSYQGSEATRGICSADSLSCRATGVYYLFESPITNPPPGLEWWWIIIAVIVIAVIIIVAVYVSHRYYKKKMDRKEALRVVRRWRKDKTAPGKEGEARDSVFAKGNKPWQKPPMQAAMRVNPDPFQNLPEVAARSADDTAGRRSVTSQSSLPFTPRARASIQSVPDPAAFTPPTLRSPFRPLAPIAEREVFRSDPSSPMSSPSPPLSPPLSPTRPPSRPIGISLPPLRPASQPGTVVLPPLRDRVLPTLRSPTSPSGPGAIAFSGAVRRQLPHQLEPLGAVPSRRLPPVESDDQLESDSSAGRKFQPSKRVKVVTESPSSADEESGFPARIPTRVMPAFSRPSPMGQPGFPSSPRTSIPGGGVPRRSSGDPFAIPSIASPSMPQRRPLSQFPKRPSLATSPRPSPPTTVGPRSPPLTTVSPTSPTPPSSQPPQK